jgi:hypothetical protein
MTTTTTRRAGSTMPTHSARGNEQSWLRPEHADVLPDAEFAGRCSVCGAHLEVWPDGKSVDAYGRQNCESTGEPHVIA